MHAVVGLLVVVRGVELQVELVVLVELCRGTSWRHALRHVKAMSEKGISALEVPRDCNLRRDWNRGGTGTEKGLEPQLQTNRRTGALHSSFCLTELARAVSN
jgi:hypothetical protein